MGDGMSMRAGFIGLGNIGKPMAGRLVAAGFETRVYDVMSAPLQELVAAGAHAAATPAEVAAGSDVIGVCVRDDDDVRNVCLGPDGILSGAKAGSVIAIHSTILPATAEAVARVAREQGVGVLDACVTGGAARAAQGKLVYLVGGEAAHLDKARPFLATSSERIVHAGPIGNGCKLKLCINLVTYQQWTAAFEASTLARAAGLPLEVLLEAGRANGQITELMEQFLALHRAPAETRKSEATQSALRGFMAVAEKDLDWALALGRKVGVALPGAALASQSMARIYGVEDPKRR
jgi:3-hydroxyisobutyrate dehydrogenase